MAEEDALGSHLGEMPHGLDVASDVLREAPPRRPQRPEVPDRVPDEQRRVIGREDGDVPSVWPGAGIARNPPSSSSSSETRCADASREKRSK